MNGCLKGTAVNNCVAGKVWSQPRVIGDKVREEAGWPCKAFPGEVLGCYSEYKEKPLEGCELGVVSFDI